MTSRRPDRIAVDELVVVVVVVVVVDVRELVGLTDVVVVVVGDAEVEVGELVLLVAALSAWPHPTAPTKVAAATAIT